MTRVINLFLFSFISLILVSSVFAVPSISSVLITSSGGQNSSSENINSEVIGGINNTLNITDWRVNLVSLARVNMPFEVDGNHNVTDYSTNGFNGTLVVGSNPLVNGYKGKAYIYNAASNDGVNIGNNTVTPNGNFTVSLFINSTATSGIHQGLITTNAYATESPLFIGLDTSGRVVVGQIIDVLQYQFTTSTTVVGNTKQWYSIIGAYNGTHYQVYVNGVLENSTAMVRSPFNGCDLETGHWNTAGTCNGGTSNGFRFAGIIDELLIYDKKLSEGEIQLLATGGTKTLSSGQLVDGQNWTSCVTPNDLSSQGTTVCSNTITIIPWVTPSVPETMCLSSFPLPENSIALGNYSIYQRHSGGIFLGVPNKFKSLYLGSLC